MCYIIPVQSRKVWPVGMGQGEKHLRQRWYCYIVSEKHQ